MPSKTSKRADRQRRKQHRQWRTTALALIGFTSMAELAKAAGVYECDLSNFSRGTRKPCDSVADKIITAIQERNYHQGWTYMKAASFFKEAFDYLRSHFETQTGQPTIPIQDSDVDRWHSLYLNRLTRLQSEFDEPLNVATCRPSTEASLVSLLHFLKSWEMKHDFGYLGKVKQKFEANQSLIIRPAILRGMQEERHYELIRAIYTEIRHIAHLCGALELVREMSDWLGSRAQAKEDIQTDIQVKVTQAWMMTSRNTTDSLYEAQRLIQEIQQRLRVNQFLETVTVEHADVVAILAELRPRLAIRLDKRRIRPLEKRKFEQIVGESRQMLEGSNSFSQLTPRFKSRYSIPLDYQQGVFLYHIKDYKCAQAKFEQIVEAANFIGWTRIEQAAYTWLATQFEALGDRERCTEVLDKIDVLYLRKRQLISQHIRNRIMGDE